MPKRAFRLGGGVLLFLAGVALGVLGQGSGMFPWGSAGTEEPSPESSRGLEPRSAIPPEPPRPGKWRPARTPLPPPGVPSEELTRVLATPYLRGHRPAAERPLVSRHHRERAYSGVNLCLSGHASEAWLMDMEGRELHRWRYALRDLWPDLYQDPNTTKLEYWRRAHLFENGDLLAIFEGLGLIKLDRESHLLWAHRGGIHHDLFVTEEGEIHVLDREGKLLPRIHPEEGVLEDFVTILSPEGEVRRRISLLEAFERSPYAPLLDHMPESGDIFHTNTLEVLDGRFASRNPAFRKGNLLISVFALDTIAVVDPEAGRVVWALTGMWRRQHQPTFLDSGRLLLFDNLGPSPHRSRVLELDPLTQEIHWQYGGAPEVDFFSKTLGSCQRLENGNTLITESENGRAFEVTPDGEIVWEFFNPYRVREEGEELVAVLLEVVRLPLDFPFVRLVQEGQNRPLAKDGSRVGLE